MKFAPIVILLIALTVKSTLGYPNPEPNPFFGSLFNGLANVANGIASGIGSVVGGAAQAVGGLFNAAHSVVHSVFGAIGGVLNGILGGTLGGIFNGVLNLGIGGKLETDPSKGGCQATNVAKIISALFKALRIPVQQCNSNNDCFGVGTGICGKVKGMENIGNICLLTQ